MSSSLARAQGSQNLVTVYGEFGGETTYSGFGAGGDPTAVAVVSDLMSISRAGLGAEVHLCRSLEGRVEIGTDFTAPHYVRFTVADRPGIIASLATLLSAHGINIDAVLQLPGHDKTELAVRDDARSVSCRVLDAALAEINALPFHVRRPIAAPILGGVRSIAGPREGYELRNRTAVSFVQGEFPAQALWVCDKCLGPLEVVYDYGKVRRDISRSKIESRGKNLWRYRELLPIDGEPRTGAYSGYTPLVKADRLAKAIGVSELYLKDDSVNHPTFSYKDRVVSVAATRAVELGFTVFGCASTGNLANSVSAHAARLGLKCFVFIPNDLEASKILGSSVYKPQVVAIKGNYDDVNRLCTQIAEKYGWGFANINLRSYYAEGAKTYGFEIAEQLGWKFPRHVVSPVAGGTLLPRIARGFRELKEVGLVDGDMPAIHAAQAAGCAPVINALERGSRVSRSREAEHDRAVDCHRQPRRRVPGAPAQCDPAADSGAMATDSEILDAVQLIAQTEGIFTEPAGGTTLACAIKLIENGSIPRDESIVVCITGNGYKTAEVMASRVETPVQLGRALSEFDAFMEGRGTYAVVSEKWKVKSEK